jgi:hypothetical protein
VAAEVEEAFAAAVAVASAAAVVASIAAAAEVMAEVMASALPSWWVPAAGGMPTASASAGGDIGPIAVA